MYFSIVEDFAEQFVPEDHLRVVLSFFFLVMFRPAMINHLAYWLNIFIMDYSF